MRQAILMLAFMAACIVMPCASSAYQPPQCATCGDRGSGGKLTAGCNDVEKSSTSGDVSSFHTTDDEMDDITLVNMDVNLSGAGNWNMGYSWEVVDNSGNQLYSGTYSPPGISVPANGASYVASTSFSVPRVPVGGSVFVNAAGVSDYGAMSSGEGQTMNYGCGIVF